jgi:hypothetical protein
MRMHAGHVGIARDWYPAVPGFEFGISPAYRGVSIAPSMGDVSPYIMSSQGRQRITKGKSKGHHITYDKKIDHLQKPTIIS